MAASPGADDGRPADACAELRRLVSASCTEAHTAAGTHVAAAEQTRLLKRDLVAAQHRLSDAVQAADPRLRRQEKEAARETYLQARELADEVSARTEATAAWARAVDHINRRSRMVARAVARAKAEVARLEEALRTAERGEQTARIKAEAAEASCLDARVRLAACEERLGAPGQDAPATVFEPHAATGGHAVRISDVPATEPLVIESLVSGDRIALELAAGVIAEHTARGPAEVQLQLRELVDAIVSSASADSYLIFDAEHPFWAQLAPGEARDVIAALVQLGFRLEPAEGWHAGRVPTPADLTMALAYAGLDSRNMRHRPSAEELRDLPGSIGVDARAYLASRAPDLAVDHLMPILGRRASTLGPLWDAWGQVRPILLSDRRALGTLPG